MKSIKHDTEFRELQEERGGGGPNRSPSKSSVFGISMRVGTGNNMCKTCHRNSFDHAAGSFSRR